MQLSEEGTAKTKSVGWTGGKAASGTLMRDSDEAKGSKEGEV